MTSAAIYCRVSTDIRSGKAQAYRHSLRRVLNTAKTKAMTWLTASVRHISGLSLRTSRTGQAARTGKERAKLTLSCATALTGCPVTRTWRHNHAGTGKARRYTRNRNRDVDNSELGKLISYIRGYASKVEAEKIRERTMRGKRARAKEGRIPAEVGLLFTDMIMLR